MPPVIWSRTCVRALSAVRAVGLVGAAIAVSTTVAFGERLAMRSYTVADGLPSDVVNCARRDSSGFLWICTEAGLARFDGDAFTTYGPDRGLPAASVRDLLEARDGALWIGTMRGLAQFDPHESAGAGAARFHVYAPRGAASHWDVRALLEDADGTLWIGAADGLYHRRRAIPSDRTADTWVIEPVVRNVSVWSLAMDAGGTLWTGTTTGLLRRARGGAFESFRTSAVVERPEHALPDWTVRVILPTADDRLWIAVPRFGICRLRALTERPHAETCYTLDSGLPDDLVRGLSQAEDRSIWAATNRGPVQLLPPFDGSRATVRRFERQGLDVRLYAIATDRDDNVWLSTANLGLVRIVGAGTGFTRYAAADGLAQDGPPGLSLDRAGVLHHVSHDRLSRFEQGRFASRQLPVSRASRRYNYAWGWTQIAAQDVEGRWWMATDNGAYRFPVGVFARAAAATSRMTPDLVLDRTSGLPANHVSLVMVDRRAREWFCATAIGPNERNGCVRRDPSTGTLTSIDWSHTGVPDAIATAMTEDAHGQVWIGLLNGGLIRHDASGGIAGFGAADGVPGQAIRGLHVDRRGRLWIGSTHGGLARVDDVRAARLRVATYTRREGLPSDSVYAIAEDRLGRIYFGTTLGLGALDPQSGHVRLFTARDGLDAGTVSAAIADGSGAIWFATAREMTRFVPRPDPPAPSSAIRISRLRVNGQALPVADVGTRHIEGLELGRDQNSLQVDFGAVSLVAGAPLRYQHRLVGADDAWTEPGWERSTAYAKLAPGRYRFEVRAGPTAGGPDAASATVSFTILPPIWQRWWFLLGVCVLTALAVYAGHRERLQRAVAVERVRMRIATDLHDDIGGTLSRMAILSEVVKRQATLSPDAARRLDDLGEMARGLIDAASDVIWSIDPRRDDVGHLLQRLREHAADVLDGVSLTFTTSSTPNVTRLTPDQRRHLYLILKEALTNIARHAGARHATLSVTTDGRWLRCEVRDDGRGFQSSALRGNGLANMRRRAAAIGGALEIQSETGGTTVQMAVPLARRRWIDLRAAARRGRAWMTGLRRLLRGTADGLAAHEVDQPRQRRIL